MKKVILFLAVLQSTLLLGQSTSSSETNDSSNVYYVSLKAFLAKEGIKDSIFIDQNSITTFAIGRKIDTVLVKVLSYDEVRKKAKKGAFTIYRIIPLRFEDGLFYVTIIEFKVEYKKKSLHYINKLHGLSIKFKYNCETNVLDVLHGE